MTDFRKYINALRKCAIEHENDKTFTGHIIVSDLCRDTANLLESLKGNPDEDCISRAEATNSFKNTEDAKYYKWTLNGIIDELEALPSIQPKKEGYWIERSLISDEIFVRDRQFLVCSECNLGVPKGLLGFTNYCPNCGIQMKKNTIMEA